jgi:AcrR family transcriptional regulator
MSAIAPAPKRRADAEQNRTLLLQAAEEVFTEHGVQAPLELLSRRAGVGRATLFRNFPDRHTLVLALLERGLDQIEAEAQRLGDDADALVPLLRFVLDRVATHAPLVDYWQTQGRDQPEIEVAMMRLVTIFQPPLQRAVDAGRCRADLVPTDVLLLLKLFSACAVPMMQPLAPFERIWGFAMDIVQPVAGEADAAG